MSGFRCLKFVSDGIFHMTLVQDDCFGNEYVCYRNEDKSDDAKDRYYKVL